jgi:Zn-dependent peptidase ImmA (M78 family)
MPAAAHVREAIAAARTARYELGLGLDQPVHDLLDVVEEAADVPVAVLALPEGVAGAYLVRRDQPFIFLNGGEWITRQRLTLAHELGHHRIHRRAVLDGIDNIEGKSKDPLEQQAFAFAGEFLAPEQALRGWLEARGDPLIDIAVLAKLGVTFGISAPAMFVRLVDADILQRPKQRQELKRQIDKGQHRGVEKTLDLSPVEDQLARVQREQAMPRLPAKLRDNALAAYAAGLIDLDRLALALRRDRDTVERLVSELGLTPREPEPDW